MRLVEQALAFGQILGGILRVRINEDVQMVERRDQTDFRRQQHAIAEHVAAHVADADHSERLCLDILAQFAEVALDRFPAAARRDAHLLVIIASRAARGESIAEPVAHLFADGIGRVGEGRRALVGRDHEIRVFAIPDDRVGRMDHLPFHEIVGDAEQRADEFLVGIPASLEPGIAVAAVRQLFGQEPALGANRHDDRILDLLRLHEPQHFGAIVGRPVRPAQAATRNRAESEMHAFDARAGHVDFAERFRFRQVFQLAAGNLEADKAVGLAIAIGLVEIGPLHGKDQVCKTAQHLVVGQGRDIAQGFLDVGAHLLRLMLALGKRHVTGRVEADGKQFQQLARNRRIGRQRRLLDILRLVHAALAAIAGQRADQGGVAPACIGAEDQLVEAVILGASAPDRHEGVFQFRTDGVEINRGVARHAHDHVMDPIGLRRVLSRLLGWPDRIAGLEIDEESHLFEDRHTGR